MLYICYSQAKSNILLIALRPQAPTSVTIQIIIAKISKHNIVPKQNKINLAVIEQFGMPNNMISHYT